MYVIYTQNMCGYCDMAKELLKSHSEKYVEIAIDEDDEAKAFVKSFAKTVHQIFYEKELIGGYHELFERLKN